MHLDGPWKGLDDALIGCKAAFMQARLCDADASIGG